MKTQLTDEEDAVLRTIARRCEPSFVDSHPERPDAPAGWDPVVLRSLLDKGLVHSSMGLVYGVTGKGRDLLS